MSCIFLDSDSEPFQNTLIIYYVEAGKVRTFTLQQTKDHTRFMVTTASEVELHNGSNLRTPVYSVRQRKLTEIQSQKSLSRSCQMFKNIWCFVSLAASSFKQMWQLQANNTQTYMCLSTVQDSRGPQPNRSQSILISDQVTQEFCLGRLQKLARM